MNVRQNTGLAASECPWREQSQARLQVAACMPPRGRREQKDLPFGGTVGFRPPTEASAAVSVIQTPLSVQNEDVMETEENASHAL